MSVRPRLAQTRSHGKKAESLGKARSGINARSRSRGLVPATKNILGRETSSALVFWKLLQDLFCSLQAKASFGAKSRRYSMD